MNIRIAAAQYPITQHNRLHEWQSHVREWITDAANDGAQLLLFPEYGAMELVSLFEADIQRDMQRQVRALDELKDDFCATFIDLSTEFGVTIVAPSLPVLHDGVPVNRTFVFSRNGLAGYQDKLFMTRFENEEWGVKSGDCILTVFEANWGKFGIQTCYDVEFPIGSARLAAAGAQILLVPSCTETLRGATRVHVGARARAMENQLYTVVSQTIGNAPWSPTVDINYGFAAVYSTPDTGLPVDGMVATATPQEAQWLVADLDLAKLEEVRKNGQVFNYKDLQELDFSFKSKTLKVQEVRI